MEKSAYFANLFSLIVSFSKSKFTCQFFKMSSSFWTTYTKHLPFILKRKIRTKLTCSPNIKKNPIIDDVGYGKQNIFVAKKYCVLRSLYRGLLLFAIKTSWNIYWWIKENPLKYKCLVNKIIQRTTNGYIISLWTFRQTKMLVSKYSNSILVHKTIQINRQTW